jgi:hypothetical protein
MGLVSKYYIELFDSIGMLNQACLTDASFSCSKNDKATYAQHSLAFFKELRKSENEEQLLSDFYYEDLVAKLNISFSSKSKELIVVKTSGLSCLPRTYFLDDGLKLLKDSVSFDSIWHSCEPNILITNYHYNQKGVFVSKNKGANLIVKIFYDSMGREKTRLYGTSLNIHFSYPDKSTLKIDSNSSTYIESIEFEYY